MNQAPANRLTYAMAVCLAILLASLHSSQALGGDAAPAEKSLTLESPCPFEAAATLPPKRVSCGYLEVPENRAAGESRTIRLPVAVIKTSAEDAEAKPDPVIFIAGGPGGSPTTSARTFELFASHAFNTNRDLVLYTQRGAAMTEPELDCAAINSRGAVYLEDHSLEQRDHAIAAVAVACLHQLAEDGHDLQAYSVQENAQDLVDLRNALGLQQWNLLAVSYGTLIAIETAARDPSGVRSMVLDSLVSPQSDVFMSQGNRNFGLGLQRIFEDCATQPTCAERFPGLEDSLAKILASLRDQPVTLPIVVPGSEEPAAMVVNWHDFLGVVHWMLYNAQTLTLVPLLIDETATGRYDLLGVLINRVFPGPMLADTGPAGMFFATVCRDQWTARNPLEKPTADFDGYSMASFLEPACSDASLGYGKAPAPAVVHSDVPTLLLSGRFDPITPDINSEEVAATFANASLLRVPNFGHSTLSGYTACQTVAAASFLDDPRDVSGFECLQELAPPVFVLSLQEAQAKFAAP